MQQIAKAPEINNLLISNAQICTQTNIKNNKTYNLVGEPISQKELVALISQVYNTQLVFNSISVDGYAKEREQELGEFIGGLIIGIYNGINDGVYNISFEYERAAAIPS